MGKDLHGKSLGKGISQRKDGRYEARAIIHGTKIHLYNMSLTQIRKDFETEKAKVIRNETNNWSNTTLNEWFDEWFKAYKEPKLKGGESTQIYLRKIKNTYIRILGRKKVELVSSINVQTATNQLIEEEYGYRSIREALSVLRDCFEAALMNRMIQVNPCKDIYIQQADIAPKEKRVLDKWEQDLFLKLTENDIYHDLYIFMLLTGIRIGELSALTWEDIDFYKKEISISKSMKIYYVNKVKYQVVKAPKTLTGYRIIPFFHGVEEALKSWAKIQHELKQSAGANWQPIEEYGNLVFTTSKGTPITRYNLSHDIKKVEKDMIIYETQTAFSEKRVPRQIRSIHPHVFRHTFATNCFKKKLDPVFVQRIMGHASYDTTLYYTHLVDEIVEKEIKKTVDFLD